MPLRGGPTWMFPSPTVATALEPIGLAGASGYQDLRSRDLYLTRNILLAASGVGVKAGATFIASFIDIAGQGLSINTTYGISWANGDPVVTSRDTLLTREAAGSLTLSGTTPQLGFAATVNTASDTGLARAAAGSLEVNNGTPGTLRDLSGRTLTATSFTYTVGTTMTSPADGVITLRDTAATSFARLTLGGSTSAFPALKRSSAEILFRLADDSASCAVTALQYRNSDDTLALGTHLFLGSAKVITYSSTTAYNGSADTGMARNAAGVMEVNNGTAGTLRDLTLRNLSASGTLKSSSASSGIGYATGAGGTVTQATNKATPVALATLCGAITMNAAALAASTTVSFTLSASIVATDVVVVNHSSAGTPGAYQVTIGAVGNGTCRIDVRNITAGSLAEAIVLTFCVLKAVTS